MQSRGVSLRPPTLSANVKSWLCIGWGLKMACHLDYKRFLDERRLHWAFPAERNNFFNRSRVFQEHGGINEDWMNKWVSHQGITAGCRLTICSALTQTERTRAAALCWGNAPTHLHRAGLSCPLQMIFSPVFGIYLLRDNPLFPATCYRRDVKMILWDTTGKWWFLINLQHIPHRRLCLHAHHKPDHCEKSDENRKLDISMQCNSQYFR